MVGIQAGFDTIEGGIVSLGVIEGKQVVLLAQEPQRLFYVSFISDEVPLEPNRTGRAEPILECLHGVRNADEDWHKKLGI